MSSTVEALIEYLGISNNLPKAPSSFKQVNLQEIITLSKNAPDINEILKITVDTDIIETRAIKTPRGTSFDGKILTGWGLIIENQLEVKIEYSTNDLVKQSIHIVYSTIPYSSFIVLPIHFKPSHSIKASGYIENLYTKGLNKRQVFLNAIIFVDAFIYGFNRIKLDI
ncbi:SPOCS domain-containing protein [Wukongibacter sp. M2B1]|uniref:SPOCS domain-containing protein n=1 Tax=Wukongibacter sp. M2B1 TaxID=3088895 RepID=UPI003D7ACC1B